MKVTDNNSSPIQLDAYIKQAQQYTRQPSKPVSTDTETAQKPADKVQLSDEAKAILQASQAKDAQPDIRDEKVQQVKMEIENGTYRVVGSRVAANMLKESFENDLLLQKFNARV